MSDESETALPEAAPETTPAPPPARRGGGLALLVALLALIIAGVAFWRGHTLVEGQAAADDALRTDLEARIDALQHALDQRKREVDGMRARLADADGINRSVREELLSLAERSRHLEDAVANLAEQRLGGRDALARNEAEFLLQQAAERLALFHDAESAMLAYRLADSALAAAEDPVFASVRDTIKAELAALEASKPQQTRSGLATLERIRGGLAALPPPRPADAVDMPGESRWQQFIARFVHVSHDEDPGRVRGGERLERALVALDLREAEAALLAREPEAWKAALQRARAGIEANYDTQAAPTRAALDALAGLAAAPLAPALPELGSALKELRNLRVTRALAQPPASPSPAQDSVTPPENSEAPAPAPPSDEPGTEDAA
ncbi:MAG: uroporphyrinogen-III C-methyltransferase [Xanthomonadales bacterium]|nr:uroporphyrinogen-III C-methyltransferase [Xanthomonadales bacterium]